MALTYKQLGQARAADLNAVSVYSPGASTEAILPPGSIIVANTSGAVAAVRLFLDDDGTTYDETTAIAWDVEILADSIWAFPGRITMNDATGNLAYRTSVASALTITISGLEKT